MKHKFMFMSLAMVCGIFALQAEEQSTTNNMELLKVTPEQLLYQDDFEKDLSQWVVEQVEGGTTTIVDGKLDVTDSGGCTVWFQKKLAGAIMLEYEATMIDQGGPHDRVSDLNCFWMAIDPKNPDNLFADTGRQGKFGKYHPLRLYYVGYGANENTTTRFRRYPGGGDRPCLVDLSDKKFMNVANKTVKIQIIADGKRIQFWRDQELVTDYEDANPYTDGWFGFRTVRNHMQLDNFRVYRLSPTKAGQ